MTALDTAQRLQVALASTAVQKASEPVTYENVILNDHGPHPITSVSEIFDSVNIEAKSEAEFNYDLCPHKAILELEAVAFPEQARDHVREQKWVRHIVAKQ